MAFHSVKSAESNPSNRFRKWRRILFTLFIPGFIRRRILRRLTILSAESFRRPVPQLRGLSAATLLQNYAQFTDTVIRELLSQNTSRSLYQLTALKKRLYRNAYQAGQELRAGFGVTDHTDALRLLRRFYRMIEIDLEDDPMHNGIIITQCYFSRYYSSAVCQVMAALDQGLAAGLTGGEQLEFQERITDGREFCRACFVGKSNHSKGES